MLARHPVEGRWDALWVVGGRVVDWGPLPAEADLEERTRAALAGASGRAGAGAVVPPEEVDEVRIVAGWVARHEPPALELSDPAEASRWAAAAVAG